MFNWFKRLVTFVTAVSILQSMIITNKAYAAYGDLDITLTPTTEGQEQGQVYIEWKSSGYDYSDKSFRIFRQMDNENFEQIQIDYTQIDSVRCLQVYPIRNAKDQMKNWVVDTGYGKGIIQVDSVQIDSFNNNPELYLRDSQGNWKYDVIFFGTWDDNNKKDLTARSAEWVRMFADAGRGVIFGHDTLGNDWQPKPNMMWAAEYAGVEIKNSPVHNIKPTGKLRIQKTGLFTTYPNYIGEAGDILNISPTHQAGQLPLKATEWLRFVDGGQYGFDWESVQYLLTYNNVAVMQTGHSNGQQTPDEQKIMANLIFYCKQLLFGEYYTRDRAARDYANPNRPYADTVNINNQDKINIKADDNGTTYYYYVQAFDKNDVSLDGMLAQQPTRQCTITQGIKEYVYIFDNQKDTVIKSEDEGTVYECSEDEKINGIQIDKDTQKDYRYFHVAAIDGAGNIGETTTIDFPVYIEYNKNQSLATGNMDDVEVNVDTIQVVRPNEFEYIGHRFVGWNTKPDGTGETFIPGQIVQYQYIIDNCVGNLILYAQWEELYGLTIDPNNGKWKDTHDTLQTDGTVQEQATKEEYTTKFTTYLGEKDTKLIDDAVREGYNFQGWEIY